MNPSIIEVVKAPNNQLEWLRVLMIPALLNSLVIFPMFLLMAIMGSDSGTDQAIRGSFLAIIAVLIHTIAVLLAVIIWEKASLFTGVLVTIYIIGNVGLVFLFKSTTPLMAVIPRNEPDGSMVRPILGAALAIILGLLVPIMSAWRLFRHAYDLDATDHSRPVELWDLKTINRRSNM